MLEAMTYRQYLEWLAFFRIRDEERTKNTSGYAQAAARKPRSGYGTTREGQQRMSGDILRAMTGYQRRRDRARGS
jgi:hypothetical protein